MDFGGDGTGVGFERKMARIEHHDARIWNIVTESTGPLKKGTK